MTKRLGFTLAEVLIVLGIIGVVAALTLPTLMNRTQGLERRTAFRKALSVVNQASDLAIARARNNADNGTHTALCDALNSQAKFSGTCLATAPCVCTLQDSSEIRVPANGTAGVEIWVRPGNWTNGTAYGDCTTASGNLVTGGANTTWGTCYRIETTIQGIVPATDAAALVAGVTVANSTAMAALTGN